MEELKSWGYRLDDPVKFGIDPILRASGIHKSNKETDIRQKYNAGLIAL
jgi:hypothetical protein